VFDGGIALLALSLLNSSGPSVEKLLQTRDKQILVALNRRLCYKCVLAQAMRLTALSGIIRKAAAWLKKVEGHLI
jgi:hypothetical protein